MIAKINPKFWPEGVSRDIEVPETTLQEILRNTAGRYPDKIAVRFMGGKLTYAELDDLADRFATALHGLGVVKGDRVALFMPNMPQFIIAYYGILRAGGIVTAVCPLFRERELEHQLSNAEAETVVVGWGPGSLSILYSLVKKVRDKTRLERVIIASVKDYLPTTKRLLAGLLRRVPPLPPEEEGIYIMEELLKNSPPNPPSVEIDPATDLVALQYTGGTTGIPKGAMLTHRNIVSNLAVMSVWLGRKKAEDVLLAALPYYHIFGMTVCMNGAIYQAAEIVLIIDPREIDEILGAIQRYKVTIFNGVPTLYLLLMNHPNVSKYDLSSVRYCISGASPLPPEVQKRFMEMTGSVLVEGYGLTEASPVTHCNPLDKTMRTVKIGSIGLPLPNTEAKIVDLNNGQELGPGSVGELVVKGPQVMKGYWGIPEETSDVLRDGWLYTGDIAKADEDGFFYIIDRKKDILKYGGHSVYPREVEDVLYEHPAVKHCAVIGKPDSVSGEIPIAYVVLKEGTTATEEELIEFVRERIAPYKRIRGVKFRDELPLTAVGKVLKRALKDELFKETPD